MFSRCFAFAASASVGFAAALPEPKFQAVTIDPAIQIGYGVAVADVDGDGKPDILSPRWLSEVRRDLSA